MIFTYENLTSRVSLVLLDTMLFIILLKYCYTKKLLNMKLRFSKNDIFVLLLWVAAYILLWVILMSIAKGRSLPAELLDFKRIYFSNLRSPISEEIFYRLLLIQYFMKKTNNNIFPSVILSALIFSLLHLNRNVPSTFFYGIIAGYVFIATGNIFIPIFIHFLHNLNVTYKPIIIVKSPGLINLLIILFSISVIVMIIDIIIHIKRRKALLNSEGDEGIESSI